MAQLTHLDAQGKARMVDVGEKATTSRLAVAVGEVRQTLPRSKQLGELSVQIINPQVNVITVV